MKTKRHVRSDWILIDPPSQYNRVSTLCRKTSTPRNSGVPGITREASTGWCSNCISRLALWVNDLESSIPTLQSLYNVIIAETGRILGKQSSILPIWHPHSESINNRRWLVWDMMMSRCYDTVHKDYPQWGGAGITVAPEWHDFKKFADDMPEHVTGVYPFKGKEISIEDCRVNVEGST